ncbi:hypothetical protein EVAR_48541_1 [Eumeta japonica]|uniref:Uncharacterized protein n=1 Tax=Eumeta variegata TaxID=151549 RepID=A0A4C1YC55_EUMVA|nr:hypothetical protein EVAR_48541_1 [Eumeta japonica]
MAQIRGLGVEMMEKRKKVLFGTRPYGSKNYIVTWLTESMLNQFQLSTTPPPGCGADFHSTQRRRNIIPNFCSGVFESSIESRGFMKIKYGSDTVDGRSARTSDGARRTPDLWVQYSRRLPPGRGLPINNARSSNVAMYIK